MIFCGQLKEYLTKPDGCFPLEHVGETTLWQAALHSPASRPPHCGHPQAVLVVEVAGSREEGRRSRPRGRGLPQACLCVSHRHSLESQAPLTDADFSPQDWVFIWPHWGPRPLSRGWQGRNGLTPPCRPLCSRRGHGAARVPVAPEHLAGCSGGGPVDNGPRRAHRQCRGRPLDLGSQRKQEALLVKGIGLTPFLDCGHKFNY